MGSVKFQSDLKIRSLIFFIGLLKPKKRASLKGKKTPVVLICTDLEYREVYQMELEMICLHGLWSYRGWNQRVACQSFSKEVPSNIRKPKKRASLKGKKTPAVLICTDLEYREVYQMELEIICLHGLWSCRGWNQRVVGQSFSKEVPSNINLPFWLFKKGKEQYLDSDSWWQF